MIGQGDGHTSGAQSSHPFSVSVGDVNRDGYLDLGVANYNSGLGNGTVAEPVCMASVA